MDSVETDASLDDPVRLRERVAALDEIEAYLSGTPDGQIGADLVRRVASTTARLEAANSRLFEGIRRDVRSGVGGRRLLELSERHRGVPGAPVPPDGDDYDHLDVLVGGVLRLDAPGDGVVELPAEMVPYQPTPARHVFEMIRRIRPGEEDVFMDLGSGLGHVALLVSICTEARCVGIELEARLVDSARHCTEALGLRGVDFLTQDARDADLSGGTIFYLYTPFRGAILRSVLDSLRSEALDRAIRVCTLGPCTPVVAEEDWLSPTGVLRTDRVAVFRSR